MLQFFKDNSLSACPKHSVKHFKNKGSGASAFTNQQEKLCYPFCLEQLNKSISFYQSSWV